MEESLFGSYYGHVLRFLPAGGATLTTLEAAAVEAVAVAATAGAVLKFVEAPTVAGVGRFATSVVVVVVDGNVTLAFPDKSTQKLFTSARVARRARPRTLARTVRQEGEVGGDLPRDKNWLFLGKAHVRYAPRFQLCPSAASAAAAAAAEIKG